MSIAVRLAVILLRNSKLQKEDRASLMAEVMHTIDAVPLDDILKVDEQGNLFVKGKPVDMEKAIKLKESATQALSSMARMLVHEQVARLSFVNGFHKATDIDQVLFYKAALWWGEQEDTLLRSIAQDPTL